MVETKTVVTRDHVLEALRDVFDPEIPVNVVDLGLVYDVDVKDNDVSIRMTLTFAGCGMGPYIAQQAEWRIAELEDVEDVNVEMVYEPPWTPDLITEDGKKQLGLD
jgi:metal-sulfur cluster biosynthetic enzyme